MTDFTVIPPRDYVAELLHLAPQFAASEEWQGLDLEDRGLTGVVFAAFTRFMEQSLSEPRVARECANAIEHFAMANDPTAENYLVTEVFENFNAPEAAVRALLPVSRALYDRWLGPA